MLEIASVKHLVLIELLLQEESHIQHDSQTDWAPRLNNPNPLRCLRSVDMLVLKPSSV